MTMNVPKMVYLEEGWEFMQKGITKLKNILEGLLEPQFTSEDYFMLYTYDVFFLLLVSLLFLWLHTLKFYVLPSLREKHDEFMPRELVNRWANHKVMVYQELKARIRDAVISLIDQEREGEQIDRALLKNVLDIFDEIGMGQIDYYEHDFEPAMLKDTAAYYSRRASNWILADSCPDYMLKAEECLRQEKDRVSHYLHSSSEPKLLEKVQHELLSVYATQLLEKEHSGCHALLRDDKVEDLSRMFSLFSKIPKGLDPVSNIFKQADKKDVVGPQE
ncbi:hypothetical protein FEM48_Zijuj12G0189400 [Ziziphus jujuba var. spinosa]|uniref:Cullin N-terminal domain-containing protein n=1 Tax=Ziziphus jujuba var. spinosa TaxID=714518 RepID=A0A978UEZ4_ZIZJJ|nr:hypothetical protein FEM48_Zijuj12G0189400 [Ziziphus jujuba var. spinosa]